ncbi:hypothetical protein JHK87_021534 [Glycine soja]|nr:hypothetical protein JHK87_021534 [Glycine soja]
MGYPSKDGPAAVGYTQHKDFQRKPKPGVMDFERNVTAYPAGAQSNLAAPPPPVGYPTKDDLPSQQNVPVKTTTRGGGFWSGCCTALRCGCSAMECLDCCFSSS